MPVELDLGPSARRFRDELREAVCLYVAWPKEPGS